MVDEGSMQGSLRHAIIKEMRQKLAAAADWVGPTLPKALR